MSKDNGFVALRRGIWEHVRNGSLTHVGALSYIYILSQADTRTGIWKGCAQSLVNDLRIPLSTAKYTLRSLDGRYIRRFMIQGRRRCYPILCHKFVITQGPHIGLRLDALSSTSENTLRFFPGKVSTEDAPELVPDVGRQRINENREERKKREDKPPADARFGSFLEFAKSSFEAKHKHPPTWDCFGKDGSALAAFLRRAQHVTLDVWQAHVLNFFDSTEAFTVKQGGSLSYFLKRFDTFSSGPISEKSAVGGTNGNVTSFSERRSQKAAAAISTVLGRFEKASGDIHRALPPADE